MRAVLRFPFPDVGPRRRLSNARTPRWFPVNEVTHHTHLSLIARSVPLAGERRIDPNCRGMGGCGARWQDG